MISDRITEKRRLCEQTFFVISMHWISGDRAHWHRRRGDWFHSLDMRLWARDDDVRKQTAASCLNLRYVKGVELEPLLFGRLEEEVLECVGDPFSKRLARGTLAGRTHPRLSLSIKILLLFRLPGTSEASRTRAGASSLPPMHSFSDSNLKFAVTVRGGAVVQYSP